MTQRSGYTPSPTPVFMEPTPVFIKLGEGTFHARIAACPGCAVVLFSTGTCRACRAWKAVLPHALAEVIQHFYEIDASEATGIVRYFDIFHLPTIHLYRDGVFHAELSCPLDLSAIREATQHALRQAAQDEP